MRKVVILGGGFAGIYAAKYLEKKCDVTLVNRDNYFVYQPMLAEVIGGALGVFDTVSPIRRLLPRTKLFVREIDRVDLAAKKVILAPQLSHTATEISYDILVLALGNVTDFRESPGLHEQALPFKNLADALAIRNRVIDCVETAANTANEEERKKLLTFVIGGGGFSGTEVCAELNDFVRKLAKEYPQIKQSEIRVVLVHSKALLLNGVLDPSLGEYAGKILQKRGVELIFGKRLTSATPDFAILDDGTKIPTHTVISTVPSSPNPLLATLDLPEEKGRLKTNAFLEVQEDVWALGDCAMIPMGDSFCPATAQFAVREAKTLAYNILAKIEGRQKQEFRFKAIGMLGALGHHSAVAQLFGRFKFSGFFAWLMWRFIYWMKLPGFDRKVRTAFAWFIDVLIPVDTVQLKIQPTRAIATLHFEAGEVIFKEGDVGDFLYIITSGEVEILGKEGRLAVLKQGEYFGEMALLNETTRNATVRALTPLSVLTLAKKDFGALLPHFKELRSHFENTARIRASK